MNVSLINPKPQNRGVNFVANKAMEKMSEIESVNDGRQNRQKQSK